MIEIPIWLVMLVGLLLLALVLRLWWLNDRLDYYRGAVIMEQVMREELVERMASGYVQGIREHLRIHKHEN